MLELRGLEVGYGAGRRIVNGVDLHVDAGEMVVIIGQNGAGKSTLLKGIFNIAPVRRGEVLLDGASVFALPAPKLILSGLAYVPQNRSLFPKLTVAENLRLRRISAARSPPARTPLRRTANAVSHSRRTPARLCGEPLRRRTAPARNRPHADHGAEAGHARRAVDWACSAHGRSGFCHRAQAWRNAAPRC